MFIGDGCIGEGVNEGVDAEAGASDGDWSSEIVAGEAEDLVVPLIDVALTKNYKNDFK